MNPQSISRRALCVLAPCLIASSLLVSAGQAAGASPSIEREWVSGISANDATLNAEIGPEGLDTEYRFHLYRYLACSPPPTGGAECLAMGGWIGHPLAPGSIPAGDGAVIVNLTLSDVDEELAPETEFRFKVEATNQDGTTRGLTKAFTTPSESPPPDPPVNTVAPVLSGNPQPGEILTCGNGSWENDPIEYLFVWLRDGSLVPGADEREHEVQAEDDGHEISCEVTARNEGGSSSAVSNALQVPELPSPPENINPPALLGSPQVGATLACSPGIWENDPTDYGYAWLRDYSVVASGESSDLVVSAADRGHVLTCTVTASNDGGASQATSNGVAVPVETQPGAMLPLSALSMAPPGTQPIHHRRCPPARHASRHRGAKDGIAARQAVRNCRRKHKKFR